MITELKEKLDEEGIAYFPKDGGIAIRLPHDFGELEFHDLQENDDILLLDEEDWHTHSSVEGGLSGILSIIKSAMSGEFLLIKEVSPEGTIKRRIEPDLTEYLRWLPEGYTYEICAKA